MANSNPIDRLLEDGQRLLKNGQVGLAVQILEQARQQAAENPHVLFALGSALLMNREREAASVHFMTLARMAANDPVFLFELAGPLGASERLDVALEVLRRAKAIAPPDLYQKLCRAKVPDIMVLAERMRFAGNWEGGLEVYSIAATGWPESFNVRHDLLVHQLKMGRLEDALANIADAPSFGDAEADATFARYRHLCEWMRQARTEVPARAERLLKSRGEKPRLLYTLAMWGQEYVDLCARHLRCLATPGNVPALAEDFDLHFVLVTTEPDFRALEETGTLDLFGSAFPVEPIFMPAELVRQDEHLKPSPVMYMILSMGIHLGIDLARAMGAAITPMVLDCIVADGSLARIAEVAREGPEAICFSCPVCDRETFLPELDERFGHEATPIHIDKRDLMRFAGRHLHIIVRSALISPDNPDFSCPPGVLFWRSGQDLMAHGFHVQPLFISAERLARYTDYRFLSLDGHLCANMFPDPGDWSKVRLLETSDEVAYLSLTSNQQQAGTTGQPFSLEQAKLYKTERSMVVDFNEWMFRHPMRFFDIFPEGTADEYDPELVEAILDWGEE